MLTERSTRPGEPGIRQATADHVPPQGPRAMPLERIPQGARLAAGGRPVDPALIGLHA